MPPKKVQLKSKNDKLSTSESESEYDSDTDSEVVEQPSNKFKGKELSKTEQKLLKQIGNAKEPEDTSEDEDDDEDDDDNPDQTSDEDNTEASDNEESENESSENEEDEDEYNANADDVEADGEENFDHDEGDDENYDKKGCNYKNLNDDIIVNDDDDSSDYRALEESEISQKHWCTPNYISYYETVRILGTRTQQLILGAQPYVKGIENLGLAPQKIAWLELKNKVIPYIIKRRLPNKKYELRSLKDLDIVHEINDPFFN